MAFVAFQAVFAIITVALISGAIADRAEFGAWMVFAGVWATVVYFPVAHWVFAFDGVTAETGGWIANQLKAIDFAGGTAVHINAGAAGLALALVLGKRIGFGKELMRPHNLPFVMLGAGLLWFGWFGFNAGSALAANNTAAVAWMNTIIATAAASLAWVAHGEDPRRPRHLPRRRLRRRRRPGGDHPGLLVGQPARGDRGRRHRRRAVRPRDRTEVQVRLRRLPRRRRRAPGGRPRWAPCSSDSSPPMRRPRASTGCSTAAGSTSCGRQAVAAFAVLAYSFVLTYVIGLAIAKTIGFRVEKDVEVQGVDLNEHAETAYELGPVPGSGYRPLAGAGVGSVGGAGSAASERVEA